MNLAYVGKIVEVNAISSADRLALAKANTDVYGEWYGVVSRGTFNPGDLCEVYLQDALLPSDPRFDFVLDRRVKMMRLRGVPSECLIMPISDLTSGLAVGSEISELVGVGKYEAAIPEEMLGLACGTFPSFIPKTSEPNFQAVPSLVEALRGYDYYSTIKVDGESGTIYWKDGRLHCCGRYYEYNDFPNVPVWRIARKYDFARIEDRYENYAFQFEMVGPGTAKNVLGLKDIEMRLFSIYDMQVHEYLDMYQMFDIVSTLHLPSVSIVTSGYAFHPDSDEEIRRMAKQKYPNGIEAEGVVIRSVLPMRVNNEFVSFKVLNLDYRG